MDTLPIDLTQLVAAIMASMLVLIPVLGLAIRFAARPFAERALRLAPDEPSVMDTAACVLTELGELEPAILLLQRAARVERRGPEIEVHLAQALARRGDREEARGILRQLLIDPSALPEREQADAEALLHELGD